MPPTFYTTNNIPIVVRPLTAADTPYLVDIFKHMGGQSRYHRFNQTLDHITELRIWEEAASIATADPTTHFGLLAFADLPGDDDPPVAGARYVMLNGEEAEAAISVRDDYQGVQLGSQLMALLAAEAKARGVHRLVASIQNSNEAVWRILAKLPYAVTRLMVGAESEIQIDLTQSKV